jgi:hypothetical protein
LRSSLMRSTRPTDLPFLPLEFFSSGIAMLHVFQR